MIQASIMLNVNFEDLTMGMWNIDFFGFNNAWLKPKGPNCVVLFDGACGLCNNFINILIKVSQPDRIKIVALQSEAAAKIFDSQTKYPDSIIYYADGNCLYYSNAVIAIGRNVGGFFRLVSEFYAILPKKLRDELYKWLAKNRYKFFGKKDTCRLATESDRAFFLD